MLIPAIAKKEELEKLFAYHIYDEEMFWYNGYPYSNNIPDLQPDEQTYKWAITNNKNEVVGYFTYHIDAHSDTVNWFGLYSFKTDTTIGIDVYRKLKELIKHHRRVEWRMIGGNPVKKHYDRFIERYGGRKVVLKEAVKDQNGIYHDDYIYEIVQGFRDNQRGDYMKAELNNNVKEIDLKSVSTKELVEELKQRDGVTATVVSPYAIYTPTIPGAAIVLVVKD